MYLSQSGYGARRRLRRLRRGIASQFGRSARSPLHVPSAGMGLGASLTWRALGSTEGNGKKDAADGRTRPQRRSMQQTLQMGLYEVGDSCYHKNTSPAPGRTLAPASAMCSARPEAFIPLSSVVRQLLFAAAAACTVG